MRAAVLTGALVALFAQDAAAQPQAAGGLAEARELYVRAEFEAAVVAFETELAAARDGATAAEAHRYLVALFSILGAPDSAAAHALAAVALVPDITPPPGAPPAAGEHLAAARRATSGAPLGLHIAPAEPDLLPAAIDPPADGVVARDDPSEPPWPWIGAAAALVAAGIVVAVILLASAGRDGARIDDIVVDR